MVANKKEIELLFKKMLKDTEENAPKEAIYQEDMKDIGILKVQWKISGGILGYQIFEKDKVSYKFGEKLKEPDISLVIRDSEVTVPFLKGKLFEFDYGPAYSGNFKVNYTSGWKVIETETGKKRVRINKPFVTARFNKEKNFHPFILSKIPIFRNLVTQRIAEDDFGAYVPINLDIDYKNQIIPYVVFKHFIDKASNIIMMKACGCRAHYECQDHDKSLGCIYMGNDTLNILIPEDRGGVVTKEEALDRVKRAIDDGLIPLLGRAMDEAEGFGVPDTGHFMSMCFCCSCCCIDGRIVTHASKGVSKLFKRMDGINVEVEEDLCVGCRECLSVCTFKGMEIVNDKARVNQDNCLGCGRCVNICSQGAISITITDPSYVDKLIKKLEAHVNVT